MMVQCIIIISIGVGVVLEIEWSCMMYLNVWTKFELHCAVFAGLEYTYMYYCTRYTHYCTPHNARIIVLLVIVFTLAFTFVVHPYQLCKTPQNCFDLCVVLSEHYVILISTAHPSCVLSSSISSLNSSFIEEHQSLYIDIIAFIHTFNTQHNHENINGQQRFNARWWKSSMRDNPLYWA